MTAFSFEIPTPFVAVGSGKLDKLRFFCKLWASGFFRWQFLKSYQRSKLFLYLQAVFGGQCGGLLFSVAAHSSHLALKCQRFCRQFSGDSVAAFYCKIFFGLDTVNTFLFRQFFRIPIAFDLLFKQQYFYSNKF